MDPKNDYKLDSTWLQLMAKNAHSDLQWAKTQSWNGLNWSVLLIGATFAASIQYRAISIYWFVAFVALTAIVSLWWQRDLFYFAKKTRDYAKKITDSIQGTESFVIHRTMDPDHKLLFFARVAVITIAALTTECQLIQPTFAGDNAGRTISPALPGHSEHPSAAVGYACTTGTVCFELIKGIPTALVALAIGLVAAFIAYRQYKVAQAKLNLDLFEQRLPIFQETWKFLSSAVQGPPTTPFSSTFTNLLPQASFLFGVEVESYMSMASKNMSELSLIQMRAKANGNIVMPNDIARDQELLQWFLEQAQHGVRKVFSPYLEFGKWR